MDEQCYHTSELFSALVSNINLQSLQLHQNLFIVSQSLFTLPPLQTESESKHRVRALPSTNGYH